MRLHPLILGAIVVAASVALAMQAVQVRDLQRQLAESQQRFASLEAVQEDVVRLREHNEVLRNESEALRQNRGLVTAGPPVPGPGQPKIATQGREDAPAGKKEGSGMMKGFAKMFTDPAMKKVMRQQQGMAIRMMYGDLAKELGLTPEQSDQAFELLADRQMEMTAKGMELLNGTSEGAELETSGQAVNAAREEYDAKLRAAFGDDGFTRFQQYERTVGDRFMMQQYQQQFATSGAPLQDAQRDDLLAIIYDERIRTPANVLDSTSKDVAGQMRALQSDEAMHGYLASQEDFNRRVLSRAGTVLSAEQLTAFEKIQKQMLEMQQAGVKMSRAMFQPEQ